MAGILIVVDDGLNQRAQAALDPQQYRQAMFQMVKKTTAKATTLTRNEIQRVLTISSKYVNRAITTRVETRDPEPPIGYVKISRRALPLIAYKPTGPGMRVSHQPDGKRAGAGGVSVKPWADRPGFEFRHAFAATVNHQNAEDAGELHKGVFMRTRHLSPAATSAGFKLTRKGFAGRLAIQQLLGPPVEAAVELPAVAERVLAAIEGEAEKQLLSQIDRFTK